MKYLQKHPVLVFFILTFFITWIGLALNISGVFPALGEWTLRLEGHDVAVFRTRRTFLSWSPNFAAITVLGFTAGLAGIRGLFKKFLIWRVSWKWWLIALFSPIVLSLSAVGLYVLFGGKLQLGLIGSLPAVFILRIVFSLTAGSIGEEAGLRGFALPRLQNRFGALKASLMIGLLWGMLHLPIKTIKGTTVEGFILFLLTTVCLSIFFTWIYNSTKGSLLIIALAHNIFNAADAALSRNFVAVVPAGDFFFLFTITMIISAMIIVFGTKGRLGKFPKTSGA